MGVLDIFRGIRFGLQQADQAPSAPAFEERLEKAYQDGSLERFIVSKEYEDPKTRLKIHKTTQNLSYFYSMIHRAVKQGELPPQDDPGRDLILADFWKKEPILSGAVYSMSAKMTALRWTVTGKKNLASYYAKLYSRAVSMGGHDWGAFISSSAQDFYTTDRGVFWEAARNGSSVSGKLADLAHIDSLQCWLTGNATLPMIYQSDTTGQRLEFRPGEFIHFSSLPSPRERHLGTGFCASSRAYTAARLLIGLHNYDMEKLNNLPPEGIAAISGLTMDEFQDALALWMAARKKNQSLTFPQVLWLLGSQPSSEVKVDITGFSQLPESFTREVVITQYVNILALVFGVDAREFWPISTSSLGTAAESEIQHMKAKGKGPGEFISLVERMLNGELPDGVVFQFDTQDIEEDIKAAEIAAGWVGALLPMTKAGGAMEEILTKDQFLRLLANKGIIPNYMVPDDRAVVLDSSIQEKELSDDVVIYKWDKGVLSMERHPAIVIRTMPISSNGASDGHLMLEADVLKQAAQEIIEDNRNIRGKPIPPKEATRGASVTRSSVEDEIARWQSHPILRKYVPTEDEGIEGILENVNGHPDS